MHDPQSEYRLLRRQTLQLLCQFDAGNDEEALITNVPFDEDLSTTVEPDKKALTLANEIWEDRNASDTQIEALTPEWPIHRQPLVDRNILRLARYEIISGITPPIVAIDEAVELARIYSTENSPSFVNGVLDNLYHQMTPINSTDEKK
jgi:N utilization substance protein B